MLKKNCKGIIVLFFLLLHVSMYANGRIVLSSDFFQRESQRYIFVDLLEKEGCNVDFFKSFTKSDIIQNCDHILRFVSTYVGIQNSIGTIQSTISSDDNWIFEKNKSFLLLISTFILIFLLLVLLLMYSVKRRQLNVLKIKNEELLRINATKDKFFSVIAHDLKSPFNSLMGFSEMLSLHSESKKREDIVESSKLIYNATRKLYSLVDNLLQWSRTQLGTTKYNPELLDISIISANVVSVLKLTAEDKDIVISSDMEKGTIAWGDKDLYNVVLRNLISNAIKFSRVGSVISLKSEIRNDVVQISVKDSGVGMSQSKVDQIFDMSGTVSTNGTFNEKGTGLGLMLCQEFVKINKGDIWVESVLEQGTIFTFTLPLRKK